jgi:predicted nucleic acid-binding protein
MPDRKVICNTSPLLYLFQIGQLALLQLLYGEVCVPLAVEEELRAGAALGFSTPELSELTWLRVERLRDRSLLPAIVDLGEGEAEAIALALSNPGSLLILDDSLGRKVAHQRRLTYTGTLGILVRAKQEGLLSRVTPVLEALRRTTMYLSPELIAHVLQEAGEVPNRTAP